MYKGQYMLIGMIQHLFEDIGRICQLTEVLKIC